MAKTLFDGLFGSQNADSVDFSNLIETRNSEAQNNGIELEDSSFITNGNFSQHGQNLILSNDQGEEIEIIDYFSKSIRPEITSKDGLELSPTMVDSFLENKHLRYAQEDSIVDDSYQNTPIGQISESQGESLITRTNGQTIRAEKGTFIFQGDIVETSDNGAVNIVFLDESSFAISDNARMTIDEFVFDPSTLEGISNFSMLQGVFVYTSGQIGQEDPDDVHIETPIGSIGIRGTIIAGTINGDGKPSEITVVEGAIVVRNGAGEQILSDQFETVQLQGMNDPINPIGAISPERLMSAVQGIQGVSGGFFNSIEQSGAEQKQSPEGDAEGGRDNSPASEQKQSSEEPTKTNTDSGPKAPPPTLQTTEQLNQENDQTLKQNTVKPQQPKPSEPVVQDGTSSTGSQDSAPPPAGSEPPPINPDVLPPPPTTSGPELPPSRINLNAPEDANNTRHVQGLPAGEQYGVSVTSVYNTINGFHDIVFARGDFTSATNGNFVMLSGKANLSDIIDLSTADYEDFSDTNANSSQERATSIVSGDYNSDGINEVLIGTPDGRNGLSTEDDGVIYVRNTDGNIVSPGFGAYATIVSMDGFDQFFGFAMANVGDINNDGHLDLAVTSPGAQYTQGSVRLLLNGMDLSTPTTIDYDGAADHLLGGDVTNLGDFNGDGYDDFAFGVFDGFIQGTNRTSLLDSAFIVTGGSNPLFFDEFSEILRVDGTAGSGFGRNVVGLGDVNGDGFSDLLVDNGPSAGKILYGQSTLGSGSTSAASFVQTNLDVSAEGYVIESAGSAGDFNADGYDDLIVQMRNGTDIEIAIIMGDPTLAGINANLQFLEDHPERAYIIDYTLASTPAGDYTLEFAHGDFNGDGFDDVVITDPEEDQAFIIEGSKVSQPFSDYQTGSNLTANGDHKILTGTALNDTMHQNGHIGLTFKGGAGLDSFIIDNAVNGTIREFHQIDGGGGDNDRIILDGGQGSIDLSEVTRNDIKRIEAIEIGSGNDLRINVQQLFDMMKSSDNGELKISALAPGSTLTIESTGNHTDDANGIGDSLENLSPVAGISPVADSGYHRYDIGSYQLYIDQDFALVTLQEI